MVNLPRDLQTNNNRAHDEAAPRTQAAWLSLGPDPSIRASAGSLAGARCVVTCSSALLGGGGEDVGTLLHEGVDGAALLRVPLQEAHECAPEVACPLLHLFSTPLPVPWQWNLPEFAPPLAPRPHFAWWAMPLLPCPLGHLNTGMHLLTLLYCGPGHKCFEYSM
jgi:hypothetical protein